MSDLWLVRHAETAWSVARRHTGRTDLPLTAAGREAASRLRAPLAELGVTATLCSPLIRARTTAELAGLEPVVLCDDLVELDYGDYEGRTTEQIRETRPGWTVWSGDLPGGETLDEASARADRAIAAAVARAGDDGSVALVAHGHILRILAARWLGRPAPFGSALPLGAGAVCQLGFEHEFRAIRRWNLDAGMLAALAAP